MFYELLNVYIIVKIVVVMSTCVFVVCVCVFDEIQIL